MISKKMNQKKIFDILSDDDRRFWLDCVKDVKKFSNRGAAIDSHKKIRFVIVEKNDDFILKNRIDLHGCTIDQAYEMVFDFIEINFNAGRKMVYLITGKGKPDSRETLNKLVPRWLNEKPLSNFVLSAAFSSSNAGELCVKLKKRK